MFSLLVSQLTGRAAHCGMTRFVVLRLRQLPWDHVPAQLSAPEATKLILQHIEIGLRWVVGWWDSGMVGWWDGGMVRVRTPSDSIFLPTLQISLPRRCDLGPRDDAIREARCSPRMWPRGLTRRT